MFGIGGDRVAQPAIEAHVPIEYHQRNLVSAGGQAQAEFLRIPDQAVKPEQARVHIQAIGCHRVIVVPEKRGARCSFG